MYFWGILNTGNTSSSYRATIFLAGQERERFYNSVKKIDVLIPVSVTSRMPNVLRMPCILNQECSCQRPANMSAGASSFDRFRDL